MNMDKPLKRVAIFGLALIVILMINVNWIQGTQAEKLQTHKLNARQHQDAFLRDRGDIISSDGVVLAKSDPLDPGNAKTKYQRKYINDGAVFSPVTGMFAGTLQLTGLELAYNSLLSGKDNRQSVNKWVDTLAGKKPSGANIETTIDAKAQRIVYEQLKAKTTRRAAAVVIDIKTGAIKVAASFPSFDPNTVADISKASEDQKILTELNNNKSGAPLTNKAFGELFPPGSSFKAVVAASALENGIGREQTVPAPVNAQIPLTNITIGNSHSGPPCDGQAPLIATFAASCNTTFALLGQDEGTGLGEQKVKETAKKFGFYEKIKIEPDLEAPASQYPADEDQAKVFLGSFGQGDTRTTPLQMALVAAAAANKGVIMQPYLVEKAKAQDGGDIYNADHKEFKKALTTDEANDLAEMMRAVTRPGGTATNVPADQIAGKTGTAELDGSRRGLSFIGFAPADNPRYAFAVSVEGQEGDFGASVSAPIALAAVQALQSK